MAISLTIRTGYIHAEKVSEASPGKIEFHVQVNVPNGRIVFGDEVKIPFAFSLTTIPLLITITVKGEVALRGEGRDYEDMVRSLREKKVPPQILQNIMQYSMATVILLSRELGVPPPVPVPPPPTGGERRESYRFGPV